MFKVQSYTGVNILQKEENFGGISRVLKGKIPTKFDNLKNPKKFIKENILVS